MDRNSVVLDTSVQSRIGREVGPMLKAKGSGSPRGCSVKGNVSAATQLKACKSTEDSVWIFHQQERLQRVAKHAAELHVETPARQGCRDTFFAQSPVSPCPPSWAPALSSASFLGRITMALHW